MNEIKYRALVKELHPSKRLGQNFLLDENVADAEAQYAIGKNVIEIGPGLGILTRELCNVALHVTAIEKDTRLYDILEAELKSKKLTLVNGDFFEVEKKFAKEADIMVSNIPYNLSSKVIMWLSANAMPALLCIQKEFAEHLLAKPDSRDYSKLSVIANLQFNLYYIMDVGPQSFYPVPRVSSALVFMKPKQDNSLRKDSIEMIGLLMNHKKKKIRNAFIDSAGALGISKEEAAEIADGLDGADERTFKLQPEQILSVAERLLKALSKRTRK